jgi:hypothetical protein
MSSITISKENVNGYFSLQWHFKLFLLAICSRQKPYVKKVKKNWKISKIFFLVFKWVVPKISGLSGPLPWAGTNFWGTTRFLGATLHKNWHNFFNEKNEKINYIRRFKNQNAHNKWAFCFSKHLEFCARPIYTLKAYPQIH